MLFYFAAYLAFTLDGTMHINHLYFHAEQCYNQNQTYIVKLPV